MPRVYLMMLQIAKTVKFKVFTVSCCTQCLPDYNDGYLLIRSQQTMRAAALKVGDLETICNLLYVIYYQLKVVLCLMYCRMTSVVLLLFSSGLMTSPSYR